MLTFMMMLRVDSIKTSIQQIILPLQKLGFPVGKNKKVVGMYKDEAGGKQIEEFVGLRAKLYSYKLFEGEEHKKCKGIKKNAIKKSMSDEDFKDCLFSRRKQLRSMHVY